MKTRINGIALRFKVISESSQPAILICGFGFDLLNLIKRISPRGIIRSELERTEEEN